jgi:predicted  nucleic acid-binding Zn-ribbon protein
MKALWHVLTTDEVKLSEELANLDAQEHRLETKIRMAKHRQRYLDNPEDVARAIEDEQALVAKLDQLMTRIRAVEGRLSLIRDSA